MTNYERIKMEEQDDYKELLKALTEAYGKEGINLLLGFEETFTDPNGWTAIGFLDTLYNNPMKVLDLQSKIEETTKTKEDAMITLEVFSKVFTAYLQVIIRRSANELQELQTGKSKDNR